MRRPLPPRVLVCLLVLFAVAPPAFAAKRLALVIGNAQYEKEQPLRNPINDANLIADVLRKDLHFDEVIVRKNLGRRELNRALAELTEKARGADAVVVYYSGHGMQRGGQNYLIPIDAVIQQDADIDIEGVASARLLADLEAAAPRVTVVVLDACRNNPYGSRNKSISKGLARTGDVSDGMLIAYATRDGSTAEDGDGANSPYALALAAQLRQPQPVRLMFEQVADSVRAATGNKQRPITYGDLRSSVYLAGGSTSVRPEPATARQQTLTPAHLAPAASPSAGPTPTVRPSVYSQINPAEIDSMLASGNTSEVSQRIDAAAAVANLTGFESYVIERMRLKLAVKLDDAPLRIRALEALLISGYIEAAERHLYIQALGESYYNSKNYAKASQWFRRYIQEGYDPAKVQTALVQSYYLNKDYAMAMPELRAQISAIKAAGGTPDRTMLRLYASCAQELKDKDTLTLARADLARYYPDQ